MPPQQQPPQHPQGMTLEEKINCIIALGQIIAKPAEAFLRMPGTVGCRYFDYRAAIGTIGMFLWIGTQNPVHATYAFYATVAMFFVHFCARRWTPVDTHSNYTGRPWIPGDELTVKGNAEITVVGLAGFLLLYASPGAGSWLLLSALGLSTAYTYNKWRDNAIDRSMVDAVWEQGIIRDRQRRRMGQSEPSPSPSGRKSKVALILVVLACGFGWLVWTGRLEVPDSVAVKLGVPSSGLRREYRQMLQSTPPWARRNAPTFEEFAETRRVFREAGF
jgi:hypothetical protein